MLIAVLSFPGTNCEREAVRSLKQAGFDSRIILWNESEEAFDACDGFFIAGGFSYEDRGRSGVISANDHALDYLRKAAKVGKPILGVCNGAQVLVESGLVSDSITPRLALTINKRVANGHLQGVGFYHDWCTLKNIAKEGRSPFNNFKGTIRMPLAHGEGRFMFDEKTLKEFQENDQIVFQYVDEEGNADKHYPVNPNGSVNNIAGVCNKQGNVLAMMPHPERSYEESAGLFEGMAEWFKNNSQKEIEDLGEGFEVEISKKENFPLEFFIEQIITDNEAASIQLAIEKKLGREINLGRLRYFGVEMGGAPLKEAEKIIETDELANLNKEIVYLQVGKKFYEYLKGKGFEEIDTEDRPSLLAVEKEDIEAQAKLEKLRHEGIDVKRLKSGVVWTGYHSVDESAIVKTGILANPVSMKLEK